MIIFNAFLLALAPASPIAVQSSPGLLEDSTIDARGNMRSSPQKVLAAYREAIQKRDSAAMTALFSEESQILENGKSEGSFAQYLKHHLGPELQHFKSFTFTDPEITVTEYGDTAIARESYGYEIALNDGRIVKRTGVATSVLVSDGRGWKIVQYHSSSRAPKNK